MKSNFAMIQHHGWSLNEIESLMPWERDIYIILLNEFVEKENERLEKEQGQINSARRR